MGCDIHAFIDYTDGENNTCHLAKVKISRDYWLFILMAGVRGGVIQEQSPVSQPKGLPELMSYQVEKEVYLIVIDNADSDTIAELGKEYCTREQAERWGEKYIDDSKTKIYHPDFHSHSWLSLEEVNEVVKKYSFLEERNEIYLLPTDPLPDGYKYYDHDEKKYAWCGNRRVAHKMEKCTPPTNLLAIQAMMASVDKSGNQSKLVFFFDN